MIYRRFHFLLNPVRWKSYLYGWFRSSIWPVWNEKKSVESNSRVSECKKKKHWIRTAPTLKFNWTTNTPTSQLENITQNHCRCRRRNTLHCIPIYMIHIQVFKRLFKANSFIYFGLSFSFATRQCQFLWLFNRNDYLQS